MEIREEVNGSGVLDKVEAMENQQGVGEGCYLALHPSSPAVGAGYSAHPVVRPGVKFAMLIVSRLRGPFTVDSDCPYPRLLLLSGFVEHGLI